MGRDGDLNAEVGSQRAFVSRPWSVAKRHRAWSIE